MMRKYLILLILLPALAVGIIPDVTTTVGDMVDTSYLIVNCRADIGTQELPPTKLELSSDKIKFTATDLSSTSTQACERSIVVTKTGLNILRVAGVDEFGYTAEAIDENKYIASCVINDEDKINRVLRIKITHPAMFDYTEWVCKTTASDGVETTARGGIDTGAILFDFENSDMELRTNGMKKDKKTLPMTFDCLIDGPFKTVIKQEIYGHKLPLFGVDMVLKKGNGDTSRIRGELFGRNKIDIDETPPLDDFTIRKESDLCGDTTRLKEITLAATNNNEFAANNIVIFLNTGFTNDDNSRTNYHNDQKKENAVLDPYRELLKTECFGRHTKTMVTTPINQLQHDTQCFRYDFIGSAQFISDNGHILAGVNKLSLHGGLINPTEEYDLTLNWEEDMDFQTERILLEMPSKIGAIYTGVRTGMPLKVVIPTHNLISDLYKEVAEAMVSFNRMEIKMLKLDQNKIAEVSCNSHKPFFYKAIVIMQKGCWIDTIDAPSRCLNTDDDRAFKVVTIEDYTFYLRRKIHSQYRDAVYGRDMDYRCMGSYYYCFSDYRRYNKLRDMVVVEQPIDTKLTNTILAASNAKYSSECVQDNVENLVQADFNVKGYTDGIADNLITHINTDLNMGSTMARKFPIAEITNSDVKCHCGQVVNTCNRYSFTNAINTLGTIYQPNTFPLVLTGSNNRESTMWCESMGFRSPIKKAKIMAANFACGGSTTPFIDFSDDLLNYLPTPIFTTVKDLTAAPEKRYIIECKDIPTACLSESSISINIIMDWIYDPPKTQSELGLDSEPEATGKTYKSKRVIWQKTNGPIFGGEFKIERASFYTNAFTNQPELYKNTVLPEDELFDYISDGYTHTFFKTYFPENEIKPTSATCSYGKINILKTATITDFSSWITTNKQVLCTGSNYQYNVKRIGNKIFTTDVTWPNDCPSVDNVKIELLSNNEADLLYSVVCSSQGTAIIDGLKTITYSEDPIPMDSHMDGNVAYCIPTDNGIKVVLATNLRDEYVNSLKLRTGYQINELSINQIDTAQVDTLGQGCITPPRHYPIDIAVDSTGIPQSFVFDCTIPEYLQSSMDTNPATCTSFPEVETVKLVIVYSGVFSSSVKHTIAMRGRTKGPCSGLANTECELLPQVNGLDKGIRYTIKDIYFSNLFKNTPGLSVRAYCTLPNIAETNTVTKELSKTMTRIKLRVPQNAPPETPHYDTEYMYKGVNRFYYYMSYTVLGVVIITILTMSIILCLKFRVKMKLSRQQMTSTGEGQQMLYIHAEV